MQEWGWAIASVILLITLVQLLAYYYLMRGGDGSPLASNGNHRSTGGIGHHDGLGGEDHDERNDGRRYGGPEDVRRCSNCGAPNENDPVYTFCRSCGAQL